MLDLGYFLRMFSLMYQHKGKRNAGNLFDDYIIKGQCWLSDLDFNWHMNNSRYLRECDFGRSLFLIETGLWDVLKEQRKSGMKDCNLLVSAFQVQYRQTIELGDKFDLVTRLNGWDDKAFYLEQCIILEKNKQIAFSLLVRFALTPRHFKPQMLIDELNIGSIQSPKLSSNIENFKDNYQINIQHIQSKI